MECVSSFHEESLANHKNQTYNFLLYIHIYQT